MSSANQIRNITLLIGIPAFLVFAVLAIFVVRSSKPPVPAAAPPRGTLEAALNRVEAFLNAAGRSEWDSVRLYLTPASREQIGDGGLGQIFKAHPAMLAGGKAFEPSGTGLVGDPPVLDGTIQLPGGKPAACRFLLRWGHGNWWIADIEIEGMSILAGPS